MRLSRTLAVALFASLMLAAPLSLTVSAASPMPGQSSSPDPAQLGEEQVHLDGLEGEITSIGDRLRQLANQSATARSQRNQAQRHINQLTAASKALLPKIMAQSADYERKQAALKAAIAEDYQRHPPDAVMMLVENGSVSETMARSKYRNIVSAHVEELAGQAEAAASKLQQQKDEYDTQKRDAELAQRQLDEIAAAVTAQESESQELLANRGNEAAYVASRIAQAKAMQDKLLSAAGGNAIWGTFTEGAQVRAGDVIGFEGSTGNSTGCHTHFSVIKDSQWVNPQLYLDGGVLRHPDGSITQGYGMTSWAKSGAYGGGIHNGVDFVQPCGAPVRAAADGTVIRDIRNDNSGFGHYVMIRHQDNLITLYGHLI